MSESNDQDDAVLSETENFTVWQSREEDDTTFHIELGSLTLHLSSEEWEEFVMLIKSAS